jgi:hypothetical protein
MDQPRCMRGMLKPSMLLLPILLISNAISASGPMIKMPDNSMLKGMLPTYGEGENGPSAQRDINSRNSRFHCASCQAKEFSCPFSEVEAEDHQGVGPLQCWCS